MSGSSAQNLETLADEARHVAAALIGGPVAALAPLGGGRNSRAWRVVGGDGRAYALKAYFRHEAETRDRLAVEFDGLDFLWRHGVGSVPQPLAADRTAGYALYAYAAGHPVPAGEIGPSDVEAAVAFLGRLHDLAARRDSRTLPPAAEACFSGQELLDNLRGRLDRLAHRGADLQEGMSQDEEDSPERAALAEFLDGELLPGFERIAAWSSRRWPPERILSPELRTLSPSDFGFHNGLRHDDGSWVFVDFEYFGWDDPVKTIADFVLHPAMELPPPLGRQFAAGLLRRFSSDTSLSARLEALYPLFGLKWCVILLNEFLPEHLLRRRFAASGRGDRHALRMGQLAKTRRMLQRVCREYENFSLL